MKHLLFSVTIKDCKVETFRAGGKGGQHQNKVESGVRVKHLASGAVGEARDDRSQHINKRNAFLRMAQSETFKKWHRAEIHKRMGTSEVQTHGSGNRSFGVARVRNYDFPDREVKDPLTKHTRHDIENVMNGDIDSFILARISNFAR